jgi:hypothetical protein
MSDKYKGCQECFYYFKEHNAFPCNACERYSHYIHKDVYTESQPNQAWQAVVEGLNGTSKDDFKDDWPDFSDNPHDVVNKPKHYMLFPEKGIEVRDVIEKLIGKMQDASLDKSPSPLQCPLFESDYVQMMQYLMRFMDKNGVEDLKKARWYLDKLIEAYDA